MEVSLCLDELDLTQQPPAQMARDLRDNEWKFKHIFRDIAISIRLNDLIKLEDLTETTAMIRTEKFRVRKYEQIMVLASGTMICVSVFDKVTDNLHQKFELAGLKPKVMVATNVNQKWLETVGVGNPKDFKTTNDFVSRHEGESKTRGMNPKSRGNGGEARV
uniref:Uncharacterized protein n=1 Tax=Brassica campestris TaxID=3711 RepID=M4FAB0_BRACM